MTKVNIVIRFIDDDVEWLCSGYDIKAKNENQLINWSRYFTRMLDKSRFDLSMIRVKGEWVIIEERDYADKLVTIQSGAVKSISVLKVTNNL